jgi:hypothetical protein
VIDVAVQEASDITVSILFDADHDLDERILAEQFSS